MIMRALTYDGFVEDPEWVYRWRDHEWGATGVGHFCVPGRVVSPTLIALGHVLDRLEIDPDIRDAWCESHAGEVIEMEFRGTWSKSIPPFMRRRLLRPTIGSIWDFGRTRAAMAVRSAPG
jgi:hypothetical protein